MSDMAEWKAQLRWSGTRICANCLHARELTEDEQEKLKGRNSSRCPTDQLELFCTFKNVHEKRHPHPTTRSGHCFAHEYDDDSVLLPKNPKWCAEGVHNLWPYEQERAEAIRRRQAQIRMEGID